MEVDKLWIFCNPVVIKRCANIFGGEGALIKGKASKTTLSQSEHHLTTWDWLLPASSLCDQNMGEARLSSIVQAVASSNPFHSLATKKAEGECV